MKRITLIIIMMKVVLFADTTATYFWPIPYGDNVITSNLGDYRPRSFYGVAHFHTGIDIPADTEDVWTITLSFKVKDIGHNHIGYIVRVQHYSDDTTQKLLHGSCYIHMDSIMSNLYEDSIYIGNLISHQTTFWNGHLHLDFRRPHPLDGSNAINPFVLPILQVDDTLKPILNNLYVDHSCHGDAD